MTPCRPATSEWTLWVVAVSSGLHAVEEYLTGWQAWARPALGIVMPTSVFLLMNAVLVMVGLRLAWLGWRLPSLSLIIPAATLANGICFHIVPTIVQGRASPGVYTAVLLYLPFSSWALIGAARDGVPRRAIAAGVVLGTMLAVGVVLVAMWLSSGASSGP